MDSSVSVFSCSSRSGEISSANPVKVHTSLHPLSSGRAPARGARTALLLEFLDTYRRAHAGRFVYPLDNREGLASLFEVYGRLATLPYGLDEVPYLVPVRHGEAAGVGASTGSGLCITIPLHYLSGLVFASACPVGISLLSVVCGVKVSQFVIVDNCRPSIPMHGDPGCQTGVGRRRGDDGPEGASCELQDGHRRILDLDPLVGEQSGVCGHFHDGTHQPLQEVDAMDSLVDQDSPAVQLPGSAPAARVVIGLGAPPPDLRGSRGEAAEPSSFYGLVNGLGGCVEAVLAYDGNPPAGGTLDLE